MWQRLIPLFAGFVLLPACQRGDQTSVSVYEATEMPTLSLPVVEVSRQEVPRYYSATGYTSIVRRIEVSTSESGNIKQLLVDEGDVVKTGSLLLKIDDSGLSTVIKQAKSAVKTAEITVKDRQEDLRTAKRLSRSKAITDEQLRKAQLQLDLARLQLAQTNSELNHQLARKPYYRITSPFAARIIKRWINQGDLAVAGKPLLQLEALQGLEFETALPARWIDRINVGDQYPLQLHDSDQNIIATVSRIVHSTNRTTQTCQIRLSLPINNLTAGLSGQIDFIIAKEAHLLIPESALVKRAGVHGVFRINEQQQAQFTPVKTERNWQHHWLVLSGLEEAESVIVKPPANLRDGTPVNSLTQASR